jgi:hypothetical protein
VASFTISAAPWPAGTPVVVYPARAWVNVTQTPFGPGVTGSSVAAAGTVTFTGLADRAAYVAWADGTGVRFTTAPAGLHQSVATPDRERIKLLEDQAATGTGGSGGGTGGGGRDERPDRRHRRAVQGDHARRRDGPGGPAGRGRPRRPVRPRRARDA